MRSSKATARAAPCWWPTMRAAICRTNMAISACPRPKFERHIAYDIGVEQVTRRLGRAPRRSRRHGRVLALADRSQPRRGRPDADSSALRTHGRALQLPWHESADERRRLDGFYRPYHDAVGALMSSVARESGHPPFLFRCIFLHARHASHVRPWHVGILWDSTIVSRAF